MKKTLTILLVFVVLVFVAYLVNESYKSRTAYEKALAATDPQQQERYMLLQMKVDDLKVDGLVSAAPAEEKAQ